MVITVSRGGYIKRSPLSLYRAQRRGGKGRIGATTKEEDVVEHLFVASTHAYVLAFTRRGRMHWIKVYDIPQLGPATRGKAIVNLLEPRAERAHGRHGRDARTSRRTGSSSSRRRTASSRRRRSRPTRTSARAGIIAINLEEGDELLSVRITDGERPDLHRHAPGHGHPVLREGRAAAWAATRRASSASRSRRRTTSSSRWTSSTRAAHLLVGHRERLRQAVGASPSTATRAAAARASSTSRSPRRTARSSGSSP